MNYATSANFHKTLQPRKFSIVGDLHIFVFNTVLVHYKL